MSAFEALLEVQERDTAADRLRHRRNTLAERAELARLEDALAGLNSRLQEARARSERVVERQQRLEADIRLLDDRIAELERVLYGGTVSASRETASGSRSTARRQERPPPKSVRTVPQGGHRPPITRGAV